MWADYDFLRYSVDNIRQLVDGVLIIASTKSNHGEVSAIPKEWQNEELFVREPRFHLPMHSETDKRNYGLDIARSKGYTHFISMDADEFYKPDEFESVKQLFHVKPIQGIVCPSIVYFGRPSLTIGLDLTLVPHIHKLTPQIKHEFNRKYPYAWIDGQIRIDPTRSLNINSGVEYTEVMTMHHYSHVRKDYPRKIRNSTARVNLERSGILEEIVSAKEGFYSKFYRKTLRTAEDYFNLNGILDKDLFPVETAHTQDKPG